MINSWLLTLRKSPPFRVNASNLCPVAFGRLSDEGVGAVKLPSRSGKITVADCFDVQPLKVSERNATSELRLVGDLSHFDYLAAKMNSGLLTIDGDVGNYLGAAPPLQRTGMSGGRVIVYGSVGDRCGLRMRRGELFVEGNAGDGLAAFMVAGTVLISGKPGRQAGFGMRRGTIIADQLPSDAGDRFSPASLIDSPITQLLANSAGNLPASCIGVAELLRSVSRAAYQHRGDFSVGGQGEWICALPG